MATELLNLLQSVKLQAEYISQHQKIWLQGCYILSYAFHLSKLHNTATVLLYLLYISFLKTRKYGYMAVIGYLQSCYMLATELLYVRLRVAVCQIELLYLLQSMNLQAEYIYQHQEIWLQSGYMLATEKLYVSNSVAICQLQLLYLILCLLF